MATGQASERQKEVVKIGLEYGRQLFIYHAGQRVQSIGQYFTALSFLTAAAVTLLNANSQSLDRKFIGIGLCVVAFVITAILWGIDTRNARLVAIDEELLAPLESFYATELGTMVGSGAKNGELHNFLIMQKSDKPYSKLSNEKGEFLQYKNLTPILFGMYLAIWVLLGILFAVQ